MKSRREFIKATAAMAGSLSIPSFLMSGCNPAKGANQTGVQIYSVRNELKKDFVGTITKVAEIGYKNIEAYGLGVDGSYLKTMKAAEFKKLCNDLGMKLVATHTGFFPAEEAQPYIDGALESGLDYLITPYINDSLRTSVDSYKRIAENFNKIGEKCTAAGLKFGYHNHAFEFNEVEGKVPMEILLEETDSDKVYFEFDLYWITKGGRDPLELLARYPGRCTCFHIKDANKELEGTTVGQGIINFELLFQANQKHLDYYFVEDERTDTPFENIKAACDYLSAAKFA